MYKPVSYTHLDVYKRQIINNGDQDPAILINGFGEGYGDTGDHFAVKDDGTVIYTTCRLYTSRCV